MSRLSVKSALFMMIGFLAQMSHAQLREFDITPIQSNRVPVFLDHPDMAAVIVNSSLPNLQFDSNLGIVAILGDATQGEYILIVQPSRQIIRVSASGFQQGRIPITPNQARQVAHFKVEPRDLVVTARGNLIVRSEPAGALVRIEGIPGEFRTPYTYEGIAAMSHVVQVRLDDYQTEERLVRVEANRPNVESFRMVPTFGYLLIRESDLDLFLKTSQVTQEFRVSYTPGQPLKRPVGNYQYRLSKRFYQPVTDTVTILPGLTHELTTRFQPDFATYRFGAMERSAVTAQVGPQNAPAASRPNEVNLQPGVHEVILSANGYASERIRIMARAGITRDTVVALTGLGDLILTSSAQGTIIRLADGRSGGAPARFNGLKAGSYMAYFSAPYHESDSVAVIVRSFLETRQTVSLRPQFATLRVRSNAPNIRLSASDNRAPQSTANGLIYLEQGQREVTVESAGYATRRLFIRSVAGLTMDTTITLLTLAEATDLSRREAMPKGMLQLAADVDAEIYVNGKREGRMQTVLTLVPGTYDVEFRHSLKNERISVFVPSADLVVRQVQLRPDKNIALARAFFMPGAGHFYTKQRRGYVYLASIVGLGAFASQQNSQRKVHTREYNTAYKAYLSATTVADAARFKAEAEVSRKAANQATDWFTYGIIAAGTIYVVQLADLLFTRPKYGYRSESTPFELGLAPRGIQLTYRLP